MPIALTVIGVFGALLCASAFGVNLQRKRDQHKSRETNDHVRLIISILVTFTAVVLGLLISNVKSSYDRFDSRLTAFAGDIVGFLFSSAIFFILELDTPIDGFIYVSSEPLRDALRHIDASEPAGR